jgi:hypothetical protein
MTAMFGSPVWQRYNKPPDGPDRVRERRRAMPCRGGRSSVQSRRWLRWHFWIVRDKCNKEVEARIKNGPDPLRHLIQKGGRVSVGAKHKEFLENGGGAARAPREWQPRSCIRKRELYHPHKPGKGEIASAGGRVVRPRRLSETTFGYIGGVTRPRSAPPRSGGQTGTSVAK